MEREARRNGAPAVGPDACRGPTVVIYCQIMHATVLALAAVVALTAAYTLLSDRTEYSSLGRRRLDAWAFAAGLLCLTTMVYGGADVERARRSVVSRVTQVAEAPLAVVHRRNAVSLRSPDRAAAPAAAEQVVAAVLAPESGASAAGPSAAGPSDPVSTERNARRRGGYVEPLASSEPMPEPTESAALPVGGVFTASLEIETPEPSAGAVGPIVVVPPATRMPMRPTDEPPRPPEPTAVPSPWATPTRVCGDPRAIDLELDVIDASIERVGGSLTVRYRAQVHNRSTFPVRLRDVVVALEGRDSGSERFGYERLPDLQVEPSVVHALEGVLRLDKSPSPFSSVQFCVSLVTETCGQSLPYHSTKRCISARGF